MGKIAVIIPAHNEEKVIRKTLTGLVNLVTPEDIFLGSDASSDQTVAIASEFGINVLDYKINRGKTRTVKKIIKDEYILEKFQYIFILDADTIPHREFFTIALKRFKDGIACVCGQVETVPKFNYFVCYRGLMYFVWQNLYKLVASWLNAVPIAPGTASVYTTQALTKIELNENIIIEDFDMTFQVHRKHLGKIIYEPNAIVTTQDPDNFRDYFRQVTRWQLGFIQTAATHKVPFRFQAFDIAIIFFTVQELLHALYLFVILPLTIWVSFFALYPSLGSFYIERYALVGMLAFEIWFVWGLAIFYALQKRAPQAIFFGPFLWLVQYINTIALLKAIYLAFFKSIKGAWTSPTRR
jgi:cellulose synthase/poly-beta-1,6-N-acetylglucosamine synthase-like glycosyltransferase